MAESRIRLVDRLIEEGEKTIHFYKQLSDPHWDTIVYKNDGVWSVKDLLAHFVASEKAMQLLIKDILSGGQGSDKDFNIDEFNRKSVNKLVNRSTDWLIEEYRLVRKATIALVSQISEDDLTKTGIHPFLGLAPLEDIIKLVYRHQQIHIRDIRRILNPSS